jgi:DNA-binding transcriptional regulator GbsR (MarR family)
MTFFESRKSKEIDPSRKALSRLRDTLDRLERQQDETRQITELKRIPAGRIAEMEGKTA